MSTEPMTPKQQQARRKELHALATPRLRRLYAAKSGRLLSEIKAMFDGLSDDGRQIMVDSIIHHETREGAGR